MDETFGIKAIAEVEFEDILNFVVLAKFLWQTFCRSCKISLVKIFVPDIKITSNDIETQLPSPHGVYNIVHNYNGWIFTFNKTLQSYKHRQFTCFNHFLETKVYQYQPRIFHYIRFSIKSTTLCLR